MMDKSQAQTLTIDGWIARDHGGRKIGAITLFHEEPVDCSGKWGFSDREGLQLPITFFPLLSYDISPIKVNIKITLNEES